MLSWLKSVIKSVLNTGLKLAEIVLKQINNKFFDLKEIKKIVNDWIKMKKQMKLKNLFMV